VILRGAAGEPLPDAPTMRGLAERFVDELGALHALDWRAAGLGALGRPEGYVERQVGGWTKRWRDARTGEVPSLEAAAAWLAAHQPPERGASIIHNDFKYDNLVLDPSELTRVVAVLDWEMATLGDPLMDLGTSLGYWVDPDDPPELRALGLGLTAAPGNLSRAELVARYASMTGRDVGDALFYYVFGLFKLAVVAQQIHARYVQGLTRDPRFAALDVSVRALGGMTERAIALGRIDRLG
jgi:aminoglycoside phosphotransferase (APT) family kinase protein